MIKKIASWIVPLAFLLAFTLAQTPIKTPASVPPELVASYESLADTVLGAKRTERNLVLSILAATYNHAQATFLRAAAKIESEGGASAELEKLAELVSQLGNEGDAAVAAVRKRLLEGGHHHNAAGEKQGIYDPGFVIVTRSAKKVFLDSAGRIGRMSRSATAASLKKEWGMVSTEYSKLVKSN